MIDVHCHLEQQDFSSDRDEVIEKCKKELKAIITCCAHPKDFNLTLNLVEKYAGFVFATFGIHPEFIKEISEKEKDEFLEKIKENKNKVVGIGEIGLDFFEVKESDWQKKQKELFVELINFSKELKLPLVIHARNAYDEVVKILEQEDAKKVLMHMFGANHLVKRVVENGWYISTNTIVLKSKKHKKVVKDIPLERIMLETDSPWLGVEGKRNDPLSVKIVAEKIAEIKQKSFEEVDETTTKNAINFFNLNLV
jgi:TatD DNase family protein